MSASRRLSDHVQLSREWRPALITYFLRRVKDHAEAEDLTQEVFAKLLSQDVAIVASPEGYIFQVASNLLADRARRAKVRASYRDFIGNTEALGVEMIDPFRIAASRSTLSIIAHELAALPERTRQIFIMYRVENLGQDVISQRLGISVSAVKKHVARAVAAMMARIREEQ